MIEKISDCILEIIQDLQSKLDEQGQLIKLVFVITILISMTTMICLSTIH